MNNMNNHGVVCACVRLCSFIPASTHNPVQLRNMPLSVRAVMSNADRYALNTPESTYHNDKVVRPDII